MTDMSDIFGDVISSYSRAQAIEDGVLVDVTETAKEAGFKHNICLTSAVWAEYVELKPGYKGFESQSGRLWDVLFMASAAARMAAQGGKNELTYELRVSRKRVTLKLHIGPGDLAEPVITIMKPEED